MTTHFKTVDDLVNHCKIELGNYGTQSDYIDLMLDVSLVKLRDILESTTNVPSEYDLIIIDRVHQRDPKGMYHLLQQIIKLYKKRKVIQ